MEAKSSGVTEPDSHIDPNLEDNIISDKDQRRFLGMRTVTDILDDMEALRKDKHELDQIEAYKMKKLED